MNPHYVDQMINAFTEIVAVYSENRKKSIKHFMGKLQN
jgi:hypothetical protein